MGKAIIEDPNSLNDISSFEPNSNILHSHNPQNLVKIIANETFVPPPPTPITNAKPGDEASTTKTNLKRAELESGNAQSIVHTVSLNDGKHDITDKATRMAAKLIEDNNFTFKPKVSQGSRKIVQNLNSDFMSRQQLHLQKQRKFTEQAGLQFKSPIALGRLSPTTHSRVTKAHQEAIKEAAMKEKLVDGEQEGGEKAAMSDDGENVPETEGEDTEPASDESGAEVTGSKSTPSVTAIKPQPTKSRSQNQVNSQIKDSPYYTASIWPKYNKKSVTVIQRSISKGSLKAAPLTGSGGKSKMAASRGLQDGEDSRNHTASAPPKYNKKSVTEMRRSISKISLKAGSGGKSKMAASEVEEEGEGSTDSPFYVASAPPKYKKSLTGIRRSFSKISLKAAPLAGIGGKSKMVARGLEGEENTEPYMPLSRSKTLPLSTATSPTAPRKLANLNLERVKAAKDMAEKAIKNRKVFTIQGPYTAIRHAMRKRGWVEKFYKLHLSPPKKSPRAKKHRGQTHSDSDDSDDDDDDDDDDPDADDPNDHGGGKIPPWEEDNGIYGIMSRVVRNAPPTFIWGVRRDVIDPKTMKKDQIINHYAKATFTTKVGLCMNMRNVPWFEPADPDTFFPRCYRLSHDEEKMGFIEDYRLTTCTSLLKWVLERHSEGPQDTLPQDVCTNPECTKSRPNTSGANRCVHTEGERASGAKTPRTPRRGSQTKKKKKGGYVPLRAVEMALAQCKRFLRQHAHEDLDESFDQDQLHDSDWDQLIQWYYRVIHEDAVVTHTHTLVDEITTVVKELQEVSPQHALDGCRNVWIVKPGAKSRGRGIQCYDHLEDMLKLVSSSVVKKESKYVVQKYIERPLLIHNYKFDIRQWFLVTDWNPLTLWFYKDSYVRFCSKEYTLENLEEAIHLSNNAVQYKYDVDRDAKIPTHLMWNSDEFQVFLRQRGHDKVWDNVIYPGMKKAVLCSLLCTQDIIEYRKSAFELYGADFMLTEDLKPWLIEINSSPSMSSSTPITAKLCAEVLEDTVKVVLDRKLDKNAETGKFELAFKQPQVSVPPYIGMNLLVEGAGVKKPQWMIPKKVEAGPTVARINFGNKNPDKQGGDSSTMSRRDSNKEAADSKSAKSQHLKSHTNKMPSGMAAGTKAEKYAPYKVNFVGKKDSKGNMEVLVSTGHGVSTSKNGKTAAVAPFHPNWRKKIVKQVMNGSHNLGKEDIDDDEATAETDKTDFLLNSGSPNGDNVNNSDDSDSEVIVNSAIKEQRLLSQADRGSGTRTEHTADHHPGGHPHHHHHASRPVSLPKRTTQVKSSVLSSNSTVEITEQQDLKSSSMGPSVSEPIRAGQGCSMSGGATKSEPNSRTPSDNMGGYDSNRPTGRYFVAVKEGTWARSCALCGFGNNIKLDTETYADCECQKDSVRILDWNQTPSPSSSSAHHQYYHSGGGGGGGNKPPSPLCSLPMPIPPPLAKRGPAADNLRTTVVVPPTLTQTMVVDRHLTDHRVSQRLIPSVYAKAQQYQQSRKVVNPHGKIVLRYTDAHIKKPEILTRVSTNSFPRLAGGRNYTVTGPVGGSHTGGTGALAGGGSGGLLTGGKTGGAAGGRSVKEALQQCVDTSYRMGAKLTMVNTHFF